MPDLQTLHASSGPLDRLAEIGWIPGELAGSETFANPLPVLNLLGLMCFWRVRGGRHNAGPGATALPPEIPASLAALRAPFGFCVGNWGGETVVAAGTSEPHAEHVAAGLRALVGGPEPAAVGLGEHLQALGAAACLAGLPQIEGPQPVRAPQSAADQLLDTFGDEHFALIVFATPEPEARVAQLLQELRTHAETIDRTYLQLDRQANVDRGAVRARELLDRAAAHLQLGAVQPLWRTSALAMARDLFTAQRIASFWASVANATSGERAVPLQAFPCTPSSTGRPPHVNLFTGPQLAQLCAFPARDRAGFARIWSCDYDVDHPQRPGDLPVGEILDRHRPSGRQFGIAPDTLTRHTLIAGHTGAGKTTTVQQILAGLADRGVPFLIIEPAKREYAALQEAVPQLRVLGITTSVRGGSEPLHLNPLRFPSGFPLHTHLDLVRTALTASFGLVPPAPYLLERALYDAYERRGWDPMSGTHPLGGDELAYPTLSDLLRSVERVVARAGYDSELSRNLRSALLTRLGSLCRGPKGFCFDTPTSISHAELFDGPTIVNLADLGSDDEKAFVMGLLLVRLFEARSLAGPASSLRHLLVVEEAHRILRSAPERAADEGNMASQAVQTFVHLLAEMRAFGQGFLAVEQLPTKLAPEVVKLAGTKLIHRLLPEDDRNLVGSAVGLSGDQRRMLGLLETGEVVAHSEGMDNAVRLRVPPPESRAWPLPVGSTLPAAASPATLLGWWRARVQWATRLGLPEVRRAAEGVFATALADGEVDGAVEILRSTLVKAASGPEEDTAASAALAALEDALLRRATFYSWGTDTWSELRRALARNPREATQKMGELLAAGRPRHAKYPTGEPEACWWAYEAELLAEDRRFAADLEEAFLAPDDELMGELAATFRGACDRVLYAPDAAHSASLRQCAAGLAISQWNLSRKTRDLLLEKVREVEHE